VPGSLSRLCGAEQGPLAAHPGEPRRERRRNRRASCVAVSRLDSPRVRRHDSRSDAGEARNEAVRGLRPRQSGS